MARDAAAAQCTTVALRRRRRAAGPNLCTGILKYLQFKEKLKMNITKIVKFLLFLQVVIKSKSLCISFVSKRTGHLNGVSGIF